MTQSDRKNLTVQQERAIDALLTGCNVSQAAEAARTARQTLSQWLHHSPAFKASLNRRRRELFQETSDKLRSLVPAALSRLEIALKTSDATRVAIAILKLARVGESPVPTATEREEGELFEDVEASPNSENEVEIFQSAVGEE